MGWWTVPPPVYRQTASSSALPLGEHGLGRIGDIPDLAIRLKRTTLGQWSSPPVRV